VLSNKQSFALAALRAGACTEGLASRKKLGFNFSFVKLALTVSVTTSGKKICSYGKWFINSFTIPLVRNIDNW